MYVGASVFSPAAVAISPQDETEYRPLNGMQHFQLHRRICRYSNRSILHDQVRSPCSNFQ